MPLKPTAVGQDRGCLRPYRWTPWPPLSRVKGGRRECSLQTSLDAASVAAWYAELKRRSRTASRERDQGSRESRFRPPGLVMPAGSRRIMDEGSHKRPGCSVCIRCEGVYESTKRCVSQGSLNERG